MGYQGFLLNYLSESEDNSVQTIIKGATEAELYLLELLKGSIPKQVVDHIMEQISLNAGGNGEGKALKFLELRALNEASTNSSSNFDCTKTPIRGSDSIPTYDPDTDDDGCFETEQYNNNCYNYGSDIVTNTFAQPGRGSSHKWTMNTCEDMTRAAIADGLILYGTDYPVDKPESGHYVALLIWPETNFHWVRLDSTGKWSHKPGGTQVRNTDNDGNEITDPSTQDFSPWTQFCAYFNVVPSKVNVN